MTNIEHTYRKGRMKRWYLRIDMTPMVDLGFLLDHLFYFHLVSYREQGYEAAHAQ